MMGCARNVKKKVNKMKTKNETTQTQFGSWYACLNCKGVDGLSLDAMKAHLKEVHGFDVSGVKVSKKMLMHMDGADWFSSQYEITIKDDLKILQNSCNKRNRSDRYA